MGMRRILREWEGFPHIPSLHCCDVELKHWVFLGLKKKRVHIFARHNVVLYFADHLGNCKISRCPVVPATYTQDCIPCSCSVLVQNCIKSTSGWGFVPSDLGVSGGVCELRHSLRLPLTLLETGVHEICCPIKGYVSPPLSGVWC